MKVSALGRMLTCVVVIADGNGGDGPDPISSVAGAKTAKNQLRGL